eukprot:scaffold108273_cov60-Phaeocystis_antarctica.AAC.2
MPPPSRRAPKPAAPAQAQSRLLAALGCSTPRRLRAAGAAAAPALAAPPAQPAPRSWRPPQPPWQPPLRAWRAGSGYCRCCGISRGSGRDCLPLVSWRSRCRPPPPPPPPPLR